MTRVIGVMSTFHPDLDVVMRAEQFSAQVDRLILVDDGSPDSTSLDQLVGPEYEIIRLEENSGIAAALNAGMRSALDQGADLILTIDQDSVLDVDYMAKVLSAFESAATATQLGVVVSDAVNSHPSIPPRFSPEGFGLVEEAIQSGLVVTAACLRDVGLLDETLFIDCVDTEFCLRVRDHGWNIATAPGSNITHSLGNNVPFKPFGITRYVGGRPAQFQYHPPFRRYYIARNNIDLCFRNVRRRPRWVASVIRRELTPLAKTLLGSPHPLQQWLAIISGVAHGLIRRRGKIPRSLFKIISSR